MKLFWPNLNVCSISLYNIYEVDVNNIPGFGNALIVYVTTVHARLKIDQDYDSAPSWLSFVQNNVP